MVSWPPCPHPVPIADVIQLLDMSQSRSWAVSARRQRSSLDGDYVRSRIAAVNDQLPAQAAVAINQGRGVARVLDLGRPDLDLIVPQPPLRHVATS